MTMGKVLKKTFAFFMAICVTFSGINPILMQSAYAADNDPINQAVDISFSPQNLVGGVLMKIELILKQEEAVHLC